MRSALTKVCEGGEVESSLHVLSCLHQESTLTHPCHHSAFRFGFHMRQPLELVLTATTISQRGAPTLTILLHLCLSGPHQGLLQ